jgi:hypothetical protein
MELHKRNMEKLKAKKKKTTTARPGFDRSKLNSNFMNVAKSNKDGAQGWATDFANPEQ